MNRARVLFLALAGVAAACSSSSSPGGDGGSDATGSSDAAKAEGGPGGCRADIDAIIARGCKRCWPATRELCEKGRYGVVQGLAVCLTSGGTCWDLFDPNSAGPCMQANIDADTDTSVQGVQMKMQQLGCTYPETIGATAIAAMLIADHRVVFRDCVDKLTSCKVDSCLTLTPFDASKCSN